MVTKIRLYTFVPTDRLVTHHGRRKIQEKIEVHQRV